MSEEWKKTNVREDGTVEGHAIETYLRVPTRAIYLQGS